MQLYYQLKDSTSYLDKKMSLENFSKLILESINLLEQT